MLLSTEELEVLFEAHSIPDPGRKRTKWIRENAPVRRTSGGKKSVKVRYVPLKMPFVLEAEAFNTEYAALVTYDNDDETLEIYTQPTQLKISYFNGSGKRVAHFITPDLFLIRRSGFELIECKTESELRKLAQEHPDRYRVDGSGRWRSPPAEAAVAEFGFTFRIRSTNENNWALIENLEFLKDYLAAPGLQVPDDDKQALLGFFKGLAWSTVADLVKGNLKANADTIYKLIIQHELYFDLFNDRLSDYEHALVFRDKLASEAYGAFARSEVGLANRGGSGLELQLGARFLWDGKAWEVVNLGDRLISARSLGVEAALIELSKDQLAALAREGKIAVPPEDSDGQCAKQEAQEILGRCSPLQLEIANQRYQVLFDESTPKANPMAGRKKRARANWMAAWRRAERRYGFGFLGLVPNLEHRQGNHERKISSTALSIIEQVFYKHWADPKRKRMAAMWGEARLLCHEAGVEAMSLKTFRSEIAKRKTHKDIVKRLGVKGAYADEPEFLTLEYTTPRHGTRPFQIGHVDHTPINLVLLDKEQKEVLVTVWLTLMIDAYSRTVLAFYLSLDPPSYRSDMMIIRECVRKHGRLPKFIVVDQGSDFGGVYFESVLARFKVNKKERPGAKARFGSVIERLFRTTMEQFIYALAGNTQAYENFRAVSPEVAPMKHAVWTFDRLAVRLNEYFENVYHSMVHETLGSTPRQAFVDGLTLSGSRIHTVIPYDKDFLIMTCPSTKKGTARVTQHGVKINYELYRAPVFLQPGIKGTDIPVRYEPFNPAIAYGYVNGQWHELHSQHFEHYSGYTEREIRIAAEKLTLQNRQRGKSQTVNAEILAEFLRTTDAEESIARQRKRDAESREYRQTLIPRPSNLFVVPSLGTSTMTTPSPNPNPKLLEDF